MKLKCKEASAIPAGSLEVSNKTETSKSITNTINRPKIEITGRVDLNDPDFSGHLGYTKVKHIKPESFNSSIYCTEIVYDTEYKAMVGKKIAINHQAILLDECNSKDDLFRVMENPAPYVFYSAEAIKNRLDLLGLSHIVADKNLEGAGWLNLLKLSGHDVKAIEDEDEFHRLINDHVVGVREKHAKYRPNQDKQPWLFELLVVCSLAEMSLVVNSNIDWVRKRAWDICAGKWFLFNPLSVKADPRALTTYCRYDGRKNGKFVWTQMYRANADRLNKAMHKEDQKEDDKKVERQANEHLKESIAIPFPYTVDGRLVFVRLKDVIAMIGSYKSGLEIANLSDYVAKDTYDRNDPRKPNYIGNMLERLSDLDTTDEEAIKRFEEHNEYCVTDLMVGVMINNMDNQVLESTGVNRTCKLTQGSEGKQLYLDSLYKYIVELGQPILHPIVKIGKDGSYTFEVEEHKQASVDGTKKLEDHKECSSQGTKIIGGRCNAKGPVDSFLTRDVDYWIDIDIKGAYSKIMESLVHPIGRGRYKKYSYDKSSKRKKGTSLRNFFEDKVYTNSFSIEVGGDGLMSMIRYLNIRCETNLSFDFTLSSYIGKLTEFDEELYKLDAEGMELLMERDTSLSIGSRSTDISVYTGASLELLLCLYEKGYLSQNQYDEILDSTYVVEAWYYDKDDHISLPEYCKEPRKDSYKFCTVNLGSIFITPNSEKRKFHKDKVNRLKEKYNKSVEAGNPKEELKEWIGYHNAMQSNYKLRNNMCYGNFASPYNKFGSVILGNIITDVVRCVAFVMELKLGTLQSITDGGTFCDLVPSNPKVSNMIERLYATGVVKVGGKAKRLSDRCHAEDVIADRKKLVEGLVFNDEGIWYNDSKIDNPKDAYKIIEGRAREVMSEVGCGFISMFEYELKGVFKKFFMNGKADYTHMNFDWNCKRLSDGSIDESTRYDTKTRGNDKKKLQIVLDLDGGFREEFGGDVVCSMIKGIEDNTYPLPALTFRTKLAKQNEVGKVLRLNELESDESKYIFLELFAEYIEILLPELCKASSSVPKNYLQSEWLKKTEGKMKDVLGFGYSSLFTYSDKKGTLKVHKECFDQWLRSVIKIDAKPSFRKTTRLFEYIQPDDAELDEIGYSEKNKYQLHHALEHVNEHREFFKIPPLDHMVIDRHPQVRILHALKDDKAFRYTCQREDIKRWVLETKSRIESLDSECVGNSIQDIKIEQAIRKSIREAKKRAKERASKK